MDKFLQIIIAAFSFEEAVLPIFVHNAKSQKVTGIIMAGESVAASVATQIVAASQAASASAQPASAQTATAN